MNKAIVIILGGIFTLFLLALVSSFVIVVSLGNPSVNKDSDIVYSYNKNQQIKEPDYTSTGCDNPLSSYPCFKYEELDQQINEGVDYVPKQIRKEPCQVLPKKCEWCYPELEQVRGESDYKEVAQVRKSC